MLRSAIPAVVPERMSGETIEQEGYKYGKSVGYRVDLDVYWKLSDVH